MTSAPVVFKKYGNRRLYDTRGSTYVTLGEVEAMLQRGEDIQVVDAKTGEDLTKQVLVQIISEREESRDVLPVGFLKQVVRLGNSPLKEQFTRHLSDSLNIFLDAQRSFAAQMQDQMQKIAQAPLQAMMSQPSMFNPFAAFARPPAAPSADERGPSAASVYEAQRKDREEIDALKSELRETQSLVRDLLRAQIRSAEGEAISEVPAKAAKKSNGLKKKGSSAGVAEPEA